MLCYTALPWFVWLMLFMAVSVDLLQMLEMNVTVAFPAAPLLTVILALVGATLFPSSSLFSFLQSYFASFL